MKFENYREIDSLREYVLVSQERAAAEVFPRQGDGSWRFTPSAGLEAVVQLHSLGVTLRLADVYEGVPFPPPTDPVPEA